ncbi:MAG: hypothetical protein ACTSRG_24295, partial [Candidatus Helarchaeota archaeon]
KLYLAENLEADCQFQIIYRDKCREWALLPHKGMSRVLPAFSKTWVTRQKSSIGGDNLVLDGILSLCGSWSAALANIEDWSKLHA